MNKMLFKPKRNVVTQRTSLTGYASIKAKTRTLPSNEAERMPQTKAAWLPTISRFVQEQQFTAD